MNVLSFHGDRTLAWFDAQPKDDDCEVWSQIWDEWFGVRGECGYPQYFTRDELWLFRWARLGCVLSHQANEVRAAAASCWRKVTWPLRALLNAAVLEPPDAPSAAPTCWS